MSRRRRRGHQLCPYCGKFVPKAELTDEHVWPDMFGGRLAGRDFVIPVCKRCNSTCGLFVDGAFGKSFLTSARVGAASRQYLDLELGTPIPLAYMGRVQGLDPTPYTAAELWISPCSSRVLHVHDNVDDKFMAFAGGNPIRRRKQPGAAIFLNAADDERWARLGLRSFSKKFERAARFVQGIRLPDDDADYVERFKAAFGGPCDDVHERIAVRYLEIDRPGQPVRLNVTIPLDFDQRFMAKVALGLGYKFLGEAYLASSWAKLLRETLWAKTLAAQERLRPVGFGEFGKKNEELARYLEWPGGIQISVMPVGRFLALYFNLYGAAYEVVISDDPYVWNRNAELGEGRAWVLIPQRDFCEGGIAISTLLAHRLGKGPSERLTEAEGWRVSEGGG